MSKKYTNKHLSFDKCPTKKHVLFCSDHKDQQENNQILVMYKFKCILKQKHIQLPEFSKETKLSFNINQINMLPQLPTQSLPTCTISNSGSQDTAIFQYHIIKKNNNKYSILLR